MGIGCILKPIRTLVTFRFQNRDYALNSINPTTLSFGASKLPIIEFFYESIDEGVKEEIRIRHSVPNVSFSSLGSTFTPVNHHPVFQNKNLLFGLIEVYHVVGEQSGFSYFMNDIIESFSQGYTEERFYPQFTETLLKQKEDLKRLIPVNVSKGTTAAFFPQLPYLLIFQILKWFSAILNFIFYFKNR